MCSSTSSTEAKGADAHPVVAGRVGRPHGLDGSFHVTACKPRLLEVGRFLVIDGDRYEIVRLAGTDRAPIVRLRGVEDRERALELKGAELLVPAQELPQLEEGEWWAHQLAGCTVLDCGNRVGTVRQMIELPSCEVLEVERNAPLGPLLVPMVKDAVKRVDVSKGEIEIDLRFLGESL